MQIKKLNSINTLGGIKALVYGAAGSGKTSLIKTIKEPVLIISAEGGLLSIRYHSGDADYLEVKSRSDIFEAFNYFKSEEGKKYKWVVIDSITEIAEIILAHYQRQHKDGRLAYADARAEVVAFIKAFRDTPGLNFLAICKQKHKTDTGGGVIKGVPAMPSAGMSDELPYLFDLVLYAFIMKNNEGKHEFLLQTQGDAQNEAKDRSGALNIYEPPDMDAIHYKIYNEPPF